MSDENLNPDNEADLDDEYRAYAQQVAEEEAERKAGGGSYEFEEIKWVGLDKPITGTALKTKVIRALGGVPNTNKTPYDARTIKIAEIICDDNKKRRFILPSYDENKAYLFWRIINNVTAVTWVDKKKVFTNELTHPDVYQMVKNNNFPIGSMQQKTTYGWSGRDMFLMNCIDRSQMAWHRENKHTMLLSKEIRKWSAPDGKLIDFPEQGVPAYGFVQLIAADLFAYYGSWNNYDIGIQRTGTMSSPYKVFNCEKNPEKVSAEAKGFIVTGPLTDEEKAYELYDFTKLFRVSSYTKWWNNLKNKIATIDIALGTHYHSELKSLVDQEKKEREEQRAAKEAEDKANGVTTESSVATVSIASNPLISAGQPPVDPPVDLLTTAGQPPVASTVETRTAPSVTNTVQTQCVENLPKEFKDQIESFGFDATGKFTIKYKGNETTVGCTVCKTPSPKSFPQCPKCGVQF